MTPTATMPAVSIVSRSERRPAVDPLSRTVRDRATATFSWLLLLLAWLLLFPTQNKMDAPAHPADERTSAELERGAQDGSIVARFMIITLGSTGAFLFIRYRTRIRLNHLIFTLVLVFFGWSIFSALWADDFALCARRLVSLVLMLLFAAGFAARMDADRLTTFVLAIPVLNLIPGVLAELNYGTFRPFSSSHRFGGTAPHPNVQAATLSVAAILLCWTAWRSSGFRRLCYLAALPLVAAFLLMTGSRTSVLAVGAALAFSAVLWIARDHKRLLPVCMAAVFLLFGFAGLFKLANVGSGEDPFAQAIQRPGVEDEPSTLNGRLDLWKECLKFAAQRPLLGYGYGSFWSAKRIDVISGDQTWAIQQSHSAYIEQLLGLGGIGLILYLGLLAGSLFACSRLYCRRHDAYGAWAAVLVFILIHNVTEAINVTPLFTNLAFNLMVLSLAMFAPDERCQTSLLQQAG
jgi:exopolysaccharide production protein ExoQ